MPQAPGMAQAKDQRTSMSKRLTPSTPEARRKVAKDARFGFDAAVPYEPTAAEEKFLMAIAQRWDPHVRPMNHYSFHKQWWTNVAYFSGVQWVRWDDQLGRLAERQVPPWKRNFTANRIQTMVMRTHAKWIADRVDIRAVPASPDPEDVAATLGAEDLFEHLKYVTNYDEERDLAALWALTCGTGFLKATWNPHTGPQRTVVLQNGDKKTLRIGEVEIDSPSPFQIRVPPLVARWKDMPWVLQVTTRPLEYALNRYPEKAKYITPDSGSSWETFLEDRVTGLVGPMGGTISTSPDTEADYVRVVEAWLRPCQEYPEGRHGVIIGGVVCHEGPNPYEEMGIGVPIRPIYYMRVPGRFWGASLVEQLISPQREYNVARSQIIENKDLMSRPKWIVPKGSGLVGGSINSRPGEIIEYNAAAGPKPEPAKLSPLPAYVMDHVQNCVAEMQDIAAQQDATEGKAPASVRSGVAIQLLQQADFAVLATPRKNLWRADVEVGELMLIIATQKYSEERVIYTLGRDKSVQAKMVVAADMKGKTSLRVVAESGLLDSKAARQQQVLDYVQLGILMPDNPDDRVLILKMLELGDVKDYVLERTIDEKNADAENVIFARLDVAEAGGFDVPEAQEWENHEVHIRRHNFFRKTDSYRMLSEQARAIVDQHTEHHIAYIQAQMEAQMKMNESQKGMPGETGKPSQPKDGPSGQAAKKSEKTSSSEGGE